MNNIILIWTVLMLVLICWGLGTFISKYIIPHKYPKMQENPVVQIILGVLILMLLCFWCCL
ncbi:hypothetical protein EG028_24870 [Chitinophaga barathri]|uniref:Uncharacterized protein n=1 Tax=Chitinophaga barathri TaxID=1647451 RepID=A0A3N4M5H1_9BACT|nr:hypothetical protein EG028_24870 [Chitinophaga barathri]